MKENKKEGNDDKKNNQIKDKTLEDMPHDIHKKIRRYLSNQDNNNLNLTSKNLYKHTYKERHPYIEAEKSRDFYAVIEGSISTSKATWKGLYVPYDPTPKEVLNYSKLRIDGKNQVRLFETLEDAKAFVTYGKDAFRHHHPESLTWDPPIYQVSCQIDCQAKALPKSQLAKYLAKKQNIQHIEQGALLISVRDLEQNFKKSAYYLWNIEQDNYIKHDLNLDLDLDNDKKCNIF